MAWVVGIGFFIILLFTFPRATFSLIIVAILAIALLFYTLTSNQRNRAQNIARVIVQAEYNIEFCTLEFPIKVTIQNNSTKTIDRIDFTIVGYRRGYSNAIYSGQRISYKVIAPRQNWSNCWNIPARRSNISADYAESNPSETLSWQIDNPYVHFNVTN